MRDFFRSPLFRCLVCLILVCCILVNVSPIRAKAFAGGAALSAIVGTAAAVTVVAGAMQALGVMPDSSSTSTFEGVVNDCVDALTASGVFLNGMTTVLQLTDGVVVKNHVNQGIIEAIHDWLFDSNNINVSTAQDGFAFYNGLEFPIAHFWDQARYPFAVILLLPNGVFRLALFSESPSCEIWSSDIDKLVLSDYSLYQFKSQVWSSFSGSVSDGVYEPIISPDYCSLVWSNVDIFSSSGDLLIAGSLPFVSSVGVATGLIAGQIGTDIETDYKTWVDDGVIAVDFGIGYVDDPNTNQDDDNEDDEETGGEIATIPPDEIVDPNNPVQPTTEPSPWWHNRWLNVGLRDLLAYSTAASLGTVVRNLLDQTQTQTQTQVADPQYKVDTSLFGNGGNGNNTIAPPDTGDPDPSTPTDPSVPDVPSDIAAYTFSLNDIFPFCIPFDLYDFLTCLDAAPVAPVIEWALQLPGGGTFPITLDLSPFDSVAQLLRRLELLIFCVGLALKTRDLIKG